MTAPPPLRWALLGASDIAATQVLPALRKLGHEAVAVVASDGERAARYAAQNGVGRGTSSVEEALGSGVDAVYVSTTNERHPAGVHAAVGAGCHVLCEKPLATSLDQARSMVDAAAAAGVVMATNHHLRNSPVHRTLRTLVADGALGRLLGVRVANTNMLSERLRGWRLGTEAGAGVVLDLTVHDADTVRFVTGREVVEVAAIGVGQGLTNGGVDAVTVAGRLTGDMTLHLHDAYTTPHAQSALEVFGTEASALATDAMSQTPCGEVMVRRTGQVGVFVDVGERENLYVRGIRAFADAVAGNGEPPCTGVDGVRSLAVALAVMESLTTGRRISLGISDVFA
ncbi:MAG: Gfo/Idh/MocA family oxidoreductase [Pseudonocardiales bacterium]|nr:Gfo/Idh/MocA family oxidoreductase [Pseudonocardiales bacterium]